MNQDVLSLLQGSAVGGGGTEREQEAEGKDHVFATLYCT